MSQAKGWTPHLRYSPVNRIIVDWAHANQPFALCGLPAPACEGPTPVPPPAPDCFVLPEVEPINTYDWRRMVPEIIVGSTGVDDDMAASYARRAGIEFARRTRVLRRVAAIELQPGVLRYPVETFADESVQGVLQVEAGRPGCAMDCRNGQTNIGRVSFDQARSEITLDPLPNSCGRHCSGDPRGPRFAAITLWAAPTEDSCQYDAFLYEQYRREIALAARAWLIQEVTAFGTYRTNSGAASYRGDGQMMAFANGLLAQFEREVRKARVSAGLEGHTSASQRSAGGGLFGRGC